MNLLVLGLSHETAPIELRERVAFSASELRDAITSLRTATQLEEAVILSTCNRTEIICTGGIDDKEAITRWLAQDRGCRSCSPYQYVDQNATVHPHVHELERHCPRQHGLHPLGPRRVLQALL